VVLRDVPSDCTVVGVPGRIVYRSGVKVNPLEHGSLPDAEAQAIRALVDRIEQLEEQIENLQEEQQSVSETVASVAFKGNHIANNVSETHLREHQTQCRLEDKAIDEFLDGSGI
ncbi:MAG: serine O-acetyltransferase, partial [Cyanobacteria bacterium J06649_11]